MKKDWEGFTGFNIGDLVTPHSAPVGVWTTKFCEDEKHFGNPDLEVPAPGHFAFKGVGVLLEKKLVRVFYHTKWIKTKWDWEEVPLKNPNHLDIWSYLIGTPAGPIGWTSAVQKA